MLQILLTLAAGLGRLPDGQEFRPPADSASWMPSTHPGCRSSPGSWPSLFAWPLALLPLVSAAPAVVFGIGIGLGTAKGARLVRRGRWHPATDHILNAT